MLNHHLPKNIIIIGKTEVEGVRNRGRRDPLGRAAAVKINDDEYN